ncbi:MAG: helix-turn-helix domain-containing protein [Pseudomonadota bacterium]
MEKFAKNLRARADALGLSHAAIAERAGVTPRAFSHYVTGQREPGLDALVRLSNSVGSTPNELLGVDEIKNTGGDDKTQMLNRINSACGSLNARELQLIDAVVDVMVSKMAAVRNSKKLPE